MTIKLSLFLAVILMFAVVALGFDNARARTIGSSMSSNIRFNNDPATGSHYHHRRHHHRRHHRHHRRHRRHGYVYYRR